MSTDAELVLKAAQNAMARMAPAYDATGTSERHDDLYSDAIFGAVKGLITFDNSIAKKMSLEAWLFSKARWAIIDGARRRTLVPRDGYHAGERSDIGHFALEQEVTDPYIAVEDLDLIRWLLRQLEGRHLYVILAYFFAEQKEYAIAKDLGVHPSRVCQIKRDALKMMRNRALEAMED